MPEHATLIGHVAILTMQVIGLVYQWAREGRQHRWQMESRNTMSQIRTDIKNGH